jgi:DNA-binding phage protein
LERHISYCSDTTPASDANFEASQDMTHTNEISAEQAAARMDARLAITGAVGRLFERLANDGRLNQSRIAERLGLSRARVSRMLSSPGNWTLDTVGDLLLAMNARITRVDVEMISEIPPTNYLHPWLVGVHQMILTSPPKAPDAPVALNSPKIERKIEPLEKAP